MAVFSLYEMSSFLNLFLRNSDCFSVEQNHPVQASGFGAVMIPACLSSTAVQRTTWAFRSDQKDKDYFCTGIPAHAPTSHSAGSPPSVCVGVVVPLLNPTSKGAPYETQESFY